jgi:hypothetical protein
MSEKTETEDDNQMLSVHSSKMRVVRAALAIMELNQNLKLWAVKTQM